MNQLKEYSQIHVHGITMLKFWRERERERGLTREKFYAAKKSIKIWYVNVDNIVISTLVKTKTNSKYYIEQLDKAIRPLVPILPKMSGCVKTFKIKEGDKDNKSNKLPYRR